jgi:Predicted redox protein, regulator of disulfide bond formation
LDFGYQLKLERILDVTGKFCPEPVLRAMQAMESLKKGDLLMVLADDPAAERDLVEWAKRKNYKVVSLEKTGRTIKVVIEKAQ